MKRPLALGLALLAGACAGSPAAPPVEATATATASAPPASTTPPPLPNIEPPAAVTPPKLEPPATPDAIKAPNPASVALKGNATGVQIYVCSASKEQKHAFEWTLKGPEASLTDDAGKPLAKHYGGPTWEATDGSKLIGALKAKADAPDAAAIPWLLLEAKSNEGAGVLSNIGWVQRVATVGGKAPSTGCDHAHAGAETRIDYSATYYFYAR